MEGVRNLIVFDPFLLLFSYFEQLRVEKADKNDPNAGILSIYFSDTDH